MTTKARKWWIAGLLSLLLPGLGHVYSGQAQKGIVLISLPLLIFPLYPLCLESGSIIYFLVAYFIAAIAFYVYVISSVIITANKVSTEYILKKYNRGYVYGGLIIISAILNSGLGEYIKTNHVKAFKMPSGSMEPTMLPGDHILVDMRKSAIEYNRGDVIVFEYPEDPSKDFIKRIVGLGGEILSIKEGQVYINNDPLTEPYAVLRAGDSALPAFQKGRNFDPVMVPERHYFVLGDNRDNSHDSRYWGAVERSKIKGVAKTIYWSWDRKNSSVRWDRIGKKMSNL